MNTTCYLVLTKKGVTSRVTKGRPSLSAREIAIRLNIEVPDSLFERFTPSADLVLNESDVIGPTPQLSVFVDPNLPEALEE